MQTLQQVDDVYNAVFVHEQIQLCSEIPVEIGVHRVAYQQSSHQHSLNAPLWRVKHVQRCQQNNEAVTAAEHLQRFSYQHRSRANNLVNYQ